MRPDNVIRPDIEAWKNHANNQEAPKSPEAEFADAAAEIGQRAVGSASDAELAANLARLRKILIDGPA